MASNISEYVDFNLSYNANFNNAKTNSTNSTTTKYVNQSIGAQVNLLSKKGWFIQNDVSEILIVVYQKALTKAFGYGMRQ